MSDQQNGVVITQATRDDVERIVPLFDAYRQFYQHASDPAAARDFLSARLERNESVIFLASLVSANGDATSAPHDVGFTQLYPIFSSTQLRTEWLLNDLYVAPDARRHGVARALLERARAFGQSSGAVELMLQTGVENHPAQTLYTSMGW
ncbi:MAG TPA: GNAT family N-acetyltransferase, partial [Ktedonobacterales bacterium]|nr:GNAT family N-acetyltransferase [Ktedonobacterales bacterium]